MQLLKSTILNNNYHITKTIHQGNLGFVYEAFDKSNNKVAIKEFFPNKIVKRSPNQRDVSNLHNKKHLFNSWRKQFEKEAGFLKIFADFEYIVDLIDHFFENNTFYIVMEFLSGINLFNSIDQGFLLNKGSYQTRHIQIMGLIHCLLLIIDKIHTNTPQVLHCDLNPRNIFILKYKPLEIKLIDFGLARFSGEKIPQKSANTPGFSPPEQIFSDILYPQSDFYSLGALIYFIISGNVPPDAEDRYRSQSDPLVSISKLVPGIDKNISRLVHTCLIMDSNQRPKSVIEINKILQGKQKHRNIVTINPVFKEKASLKNNSIDQSVGHILRGKDMDMQINLCPVCFKESETYICVHCQFNRYEHRNSEQFLKEFTVLNQNHIIGRVIGEPGGSGVVYSAFHKELYRHEAIKEYFPKNWAERNGLHVIPKQGVENYFSLWLHQFRDEAKKIQRLDGKNHVVKIHDVFSANDTQYIVMEKVPGQTLFEHRKSKRMNLKEINEILIILLEMLDYIHGKGIIHNDLTYKNIIYPDNDLNKLKVIDFGLSDDIAIKKKIEIDGPAYTEGFASPEQMLSQKTTHASDFYALGANLFYMVKGEIPMDAIRRMKNKEKLDIFELYHQDRNLYETITACMTLEKEKRPQTIDDIKTILKTKHNNDYIAVNLKEDRNSIFFYALFFLVTFLMALFALLQII